MISKLQDRVNRGVHYLLAEMPDQFYPEKVELRVAPYTLSRATLRAVKRAGGEYSRISPSSSCRFVTLPVTESETIACVFRDAKIAKGVIFREQRARMPAWVNVQLNQRSYFDAIQSYRKSVDEYDRRYPAKVTEPEPVKPAEPEVKKQVIVTFTLDTDMSEKEAVERAQYALENEFAAVTFVESTPLETEE